MVMAEVDCLRKMRHPNIISYRGAWSEDNRSYILMEYAMRGTLKDLLKKQQEPLKEEDTLYLFSQISLGVHHIHSKNVLHRDLKPENIMLTGRRAEIVKIGDFGVSRSVNELSRSHAGSYNYMAPEMLKKEPCDFKCDIWSMGVVLYEMVANRLPFPAQTQEEIVEMVCNARPRPLPRNTRIDTVNLLSKMLRRDAERRPTSYRVVHCPYLVPSIIRVCLNVGRNPNHAEWNAENLEYHQFERFLKTRDPFPMEERRPRRRAI
ncbi:serine/threonine-protein kinase nekl-2 isoform X2 [Orussus abietinus]|nr:serine/threonine-protein kinase nekl-2 isoform X2 [Orussus abietinus]